MAGVCGEPAPVGLAKAVKRLNPGKATQATPAERCCLTVCNTAVSPSLSFMLAQYAGSLLEQPSIVAAHVGLVLPVLSEFGIESSQSVSTREAKPEIPVLGLPQSRIEDANVLKGAPANHGRAHADAVALKKLPVALRVTLVPGGDSFVIRSDYLECR
jgi:hypothetical protein